MKSLDVPQKLLRSRRVRAKLRALRVSRRKPLYRLNFRLFPALISLRRGALKLLPREQQQSSDVSHGLGSVSAADKSQSLETLLYREYSTHATDARSIAAHITESLLAPQNLLDELNQKLFDSFSQLVDNVSIQPAALRQGGTPADTDDEYQLLGSNVL